MASRLGTSYTTGLCLPTDQRPPQRRFNSNYTTNQHCPLPYQSYAGPSRVSTRTCPDERTSRRRELTNGWVSGLAVPGPYTWSAPRVRRTLSARAVGPVRSAANAENTDAPKSSLRLILDSADVQQWKCYFPTGIFYGITTNPTILERDGVPCSLFALASLAEEAFAVGAQEIQLQAWGDTSGELVRCGTALAALDPRVVVKVPITLEGTAAAAALVHQGVQVTMTAVYSPHQALTAAAVGAAYAAPYLGRMNDNGRPGADNILQMHRIVEASGSPMRVLVASVREAGELAALAAEGLDTFTFSPAVAAQLFADPLTTAAAEDFAAAAARNAAPQPGSPAPQPGSPAPQPGSPAPQPGSPAPQPGSPAPQPGSPAPQPGSPAPAAASSAPSLTRRASCLLGPLGLAAAAVGGGTGAARAAEEDAGVFGAASGPLEPGPEGLRYADLEVGKGASADFLLEGDVVKVNFTAWGPGSAAEPERVADKGRNFVFGIGMGEVPPGLEVALTGGGSMPAMNIGGVREVLLPPRLAFGDRGALCDQVAGTCAVGPGEAVLVRLELAGIKGITKFTGASSAPPLFSQAGQDWGRMGLGTIPGAPTASDTGLNIK